MSATADTTTALNSVTNFTALSIAFSEQNTISVYFAHLQNIFKEMYQANLTQEYQKQTPLFQKIDKVLFDIFSENLKLQKDHINTSMNLKNMLTECSELIVECKNDRQQLVRVTEDRQMILQKLKQCTNQSLQICQQNQSLCQQLIKVKQINSLLTQKMSVLEHQINNVSTSSQNYSHLVSLSHQFQNLSSHNTQIQEDISDILKTTQMYGNASQPLQIMCLAFESKPQWREDMWKVVEEKYKNRFQNIQQTKQNFFKFGYLDALMLFSNKQKA